MVLSTDTNPELTRDQVATMLTEPLQRFSTFLEAGSTFYVTDGNRVRVPEGFKRGIDEILAEKWVGENKLIPEVDPDLADEIILLPETIKSIKTLTTFSNELARQSVMSLEQALQKRLVRDVADAFVRRFLAADGDGVTEPQGMFAWPGVQTVDAAEWDIDTIMDG